MHTHIINVLGDKMLIIKCKTINSCREFNKKINFCSISYKKEDITVKSRFPNILHLDQRCKHGSLSMLFGHML